MKKINKLFLLVAICFMSLSASAQLSVGARIGANISDQLLEDKSGEKTNFDSKTGLSVAIPLEIKLIGPISLQAELMYIQKGASTTFDLLGKSVKTTTNYNYAEIPLLLKLKFLQLENLHFYAVGGPGFAYALGGNVDTDGTKVNINFDDESLKNFERFETNLNLGVGFGIAQGSGDIVFDIRYAFSLSDIDSSDEFISRNLGVGFSVGYMYTLGQ